MRRKHSQLNPIAQGVAMKALLGPFAAAILLLALAA